MVTPFWVWEPGGGEGQWRVLRRTSAYVCVACGSELFLGKGGVFFKEKLDVSDKKINWHT